MTLQEAYVKAKISNKAYESAYLKSCRDYGDFWTFSFSPIPYDPEDRSTWVVGGLVKVDKKTGMARSSGAPEIMRLKGELVPLEQLDGLIRPVEKATKKQVRAPRVAVAS
jgi:hypothetical protein